MIQKDDEITKEVREKRPRKLRKFFFPQQGKMIEAEDHEQALKIINKLNK